MPKNQKAESTVLVEIPLGDAPEADSYERQKLNRGIVSVQAKLGKHAATAFVRVRNGLRDKNARLQSGRPVWSNADALKWIMEQIEP